MKDIMLVIKIPEEIYKASQILDVKYGDVIQIPLEVIANGTPLPKGHGDLIDKDRLLDELEKTVKSVDDNKKHLLFWDRAVAYVHLSEPIIKAESEEEE